MKIESHQKMELINGDQVRGKRLAMEDPEYYLVEITEQLKVDSNVGCKVIVPKDKVFKYSHKEKEDGGYVQYVIFEQYEVIAQFSKHDDKKKFVVACTYCDMLVEENANLRKEAKENAKPKADNKVKGQDQSNQNQNKSQQ